MLEQNVSRNLDQMEDVETQYKIEVSRTVSTSAYV